MSDSVLRSWVSVPKGSDFPLGNLPLGIFSTSDRPAMRAGIALGDQIIDLGVLHAEGFLDELSLRRGIFEQGSWNEFLGLGKGALRVLRARLLALFDEGSSELRDQVTLHGSLFCDRRTARLYLPVEVGDYTDFYSSIEHATNVGSLFRDPENPLLPNWRHMPVGYHGRASSIVCSGTPVCRPLGQCKPPGVEVPVFGPSQKLDFELEMAFVSCGRTELGQRVGVDEAEEYIAGLLLFNDWSARDIQAWEYVPLGPFLGKSFASSVSPWIVMLEALAPFRVDMPEQVPPPLPYLRGRRDANFDIYIEAYLQVPDQPSHCVVRTNFRYMYWSMAQQLAHQTVGGCNIRPGDLYASGTISGPSEGSFGSLLELTWNGERPIKLLNGVERCFLEDGDYVAVTAYGERGDFRIGFGIMEGTIQPALPLSQKKR